ncbi:hypothetical protein K435DRAFT_873625 [Dendrothele bispora CBS 962.96]|uniref:Uncharacterized protein n=1 Tax=Dendrothele bispora (strain CBS 962.96) TaxID=1314807 RepID=A0A4S8KYN5_DENBC|nr:hypothetical protein K435DRAFT_873625 [Dendrothele bispora CBS 962.96]
MEEEKAMDNAEPLGDIVTKVANASAPPSLVVSSHNSSPDSELFLSNCETIAVLSLAPGCHTLFHSNVFDIQKAGMYDLKDGGEQRAPSSKCPPGASSINAETVSQAARHWVPNMANEATHQCKSRLSPFIA